MKKMFEMPSVEVETILSNESVMADLTEQDLGWGSGAGWWE